jgi:hypothetical protein
MMIMIIIIIIRGVFVVFWYLCLCSCIESDKYGRNRLVCAEETLVGVEHKHEYAFCFSKDTKNCKSFWFISFPTFPLVQLPAVQTALSARAINRYWNTGSLLFIASGFTTALRTLHGTTSNAAYRRSSSRPWVGVYAFLLNCMALNVMGSLINFC